MTDQTGSPLFIPNAVEVRPPTDEEFVSRQGRRGVGLVVYLVGGKDFELWAFFQDRTRAFAAKNLNPVFG